jgi:hypothetical protein
MRAAFLGMTFLLLANTWACGQGNLPAAMTRLVNDDTLVVVHLDLKTLNAAPGGTRLFWIQVNRCLRWQRPSIRRWQN